MRRCFLDSAPFEEVSAIPFISDGLNSGPSLKVISSTICQDTISVFQTLATLKVEERQGAFAFVGP